MSTQRDKFFGVWAAHSVGMSLAPRWREREVNRMRKRVVLLSATTLFALSLTFAGCDKKEEPAPPPPPAAPGEQKKAPAEKPGGAMQPEKKEEGAKTK